MKTFIFPNGVKIINSTFFNICFIANFAFVLQMLRAKPLPLCRAGVTLAALLA